MNKIFKILWDLLGICLVLLIILSAYLWHCNFITLMFAACLGIWVWNNEQFNHLNMDKLKEVFDVEYVQTQCLAAWKDRQFLLTNKQHYNYAHLYINRQ